MVGGHEGWGDSELVLRFQTWNRSTWDSDLMEGFRWKALLRLWVVVQVDTTCKWKEG